MNRRLRMLGPDDYKAIAEMALICIVAVLLFGPPIGSLFIVILVGLAMVASKDI